MNETFYQSADIKEQKNNGGVSPEPSIDQKYTNDPKYFANHSHLSKKVDDYFSNAKSPAMSGKGEEFWQRLNPVSNLQGLAKMQAEKKNKEKKQSLVEALTRENITQEEFDKILLDYFEQGIISQEQKVEVKEGVWVDIKDNFIRIEIKEDVAETKVNVAETKVNVAETKVNVAETKVNVADTKEKTSNEILQLENAYQEYQKLAKAHPQLEVKPNSEAFNQEKQRLQSDPKRENLAIWTPEQQETYIIVSAANNLLKTDTTISNEEKKDFLSSFGKLERMLINEAGGKPETQHSFSAEKFSDTAGIIFDKNVGNPALLADFEKATTSSNSKYTELLGDKEKMSLEELDTQYGKFTLKAHETYTTLLKKAEQSRTPEEVQRLEQYKNHLLDIKSLVDTPTKTTMEQLNLLWPVIGMSSYLNLPAGENFALNASKDIKFEGDYITMTGIVKGKSFTMRTNRNATAKLETSDFLADANPETPNATAFTVGSNNFQKTPYDMPNTKVWDTIKSTQQTLRAKEMEKEKPDLKQYQIDLQQRLHEEIQKLYNENDRKELVQIRMERQVEKEVLNQEFFAGFSTLMELTARPPSFLDKATASPQVLNFFRKFDQFQEDASIDQLKMRRQCMNELIPMLVAKKHPEQSSTNKNACKLFAHIDPDMINNTKDMLKGNVEKTPNLFEGVFSMILPLETENANTEYSSSTTRAKLVDLQQALKDKDGKKGTDEYKILGQWYKEKYVDDDLGSSYDEASKEGGNE